MSKAKKSNTPEVEPLEEQETSVPPARAPAALRPGTVEFLEAENKKLVAQVKLGVLDDLIGEGKATPAQAAALKDKAAAGEDISAALDVLASNTPIAGLGGEPLHDPLRGGGKSSLERFIDNKYGLKA